MTPLELHLLGPPNVFSDGVPLSFPTRKSLALLVYLVVEGEAHTRDHLAALLWPESDPGRARPTLRNCLYQLRVTLPGDDVLHVERDTVAFNADTDYHLDLDIIIAATELLTPAPPHPLTRSHLQTLQQAVTAYRGDFLEGFSLGDAPAFDDWATFQRELWHQRLETIYDHLSQTEFEQGHVHEAIETTTRWLDHNPLNETAHRRLMRLHQASGDRAAALQAYDTCRQTLAEELGVEPAPETEALAAQIRNAEVGMRSEARQPIPHSEFRTPPFSRGPLVGRTEAFGTLVEQFHRAAEGMPQLVTITGEAGIGKTRLAGDFLAWAEAHGATIVRGRSFESGRRLPYQPLVDALRPCVEAINAPEDYLSDTWLAELSRLLPELLDRYPDLHPAQLDEAAARTRLFEAITRLTLSLADHSPARPFLLFLDDLQWADAASLDVLQYAGRRWQESYAPILLLVTARAEALHPMSVAHAPHLAECLDGLERLLQTTTLPLGPLTIADTERFVSAFGATDAGDFVRWLFGETGGQPFYLVETLEDLREQGVVEADVDAEGQWQLRAKSPGRDATQHAPTAGVPEKVRHVIAARLSRLSPPAFDLLAASAVLAQGFTFELLCQVADVSEGDGLHALDELLRGQLLRESQSTYLFAHDKIRDVTYTEAGDARRRIFHRRALAALGERGAPAGQLAHHARAAGDAQATFRHSLTAGDEALKLFAARDAITHYEQARTASDQLSVTNDQLQRLYVQLGRAYELAGDYDAALAVYDALQALAQEREDKPLELAALMARTTIYAAPTQHYDPEHVAVLTEQALPLARELGDHAAESKIQWNLMLLKLFTGDIGEAVTAGETSLAIARKHNLRERMAYALHDLIRAYLFSGRAEEGIAVAKEAQALWRELDNKAMLADNLVSTASAMFFWQGAYEEIIPRLQEALALSKKIDNLWNQSYANHILGMVYFDLGYMSQAIVACEQAVELGLQAGFVVPLFTNGSGLAWLYGMAGQPERGFPWVEKGLQEETVMRDQQSAPLAVKAFLHLCQGDLDQADKTIRQSYAGLELHALSAAAFFTFPIDGRIRLAWREYEEALSVSERFIDYLRQTQLQPFRADAFFVKGRALLSLGRMDEAETALGAARRRAEALTSRRILWEILGAQAEVAAQQEDQEKAATLRQQAREVVHFIANQFDDPELRASFLETSEI